MKEKVIFTTVLCLSAMTPMMAQNITGKVMNTKGEPLAFVNVVLLNRTDSAFVKGAVSGEDGSFAIDSSCNGGIIKVTRIFPGLIIHQIRISPHLRYMDLCLSA